MGTSANILKDGEEQVIRQAGDRSERPAAFANARAIDAQDIHRRIEVVKESIACCEALCLPLWRQQ
jgi:hypothetical protein